MDTNQNSQSKESPVLNVVLHGAFAFERKSGSIEVLVPAMDHHVFRAGSWLGETELRGRGTRYELKGVTPGKATFDPARNLILAKSQMQAGHPPARTTLVFPIPERITSLRVAKVPKTSFSNTADLVVNAPEQHVATLQVFSYCFQDENELFLKASTGDGHYWEPAFSGDFINLHIFSAEEHFTKPSNSEEDFNLCAKLLGSQLQLNTRLVPTGILDSGELPPGVTEVETEDLADRTLRMARLGRLVSQKGDANLAWYGNDALDGNPEACGSPVSDDGQH